jgi:hypothetical protein
MDTSSDWMSTARRMWLWPVAILVSFPIGGYIADLVVDGVDSVGAALAGGLIVGAVIGAAEWFVLRQWVSWLWIPATNCGDERCRHRLPALGREASATDLARRAASWPDDRCCSAFEQALACAH